jgi:hypothetical protein
MTPDPTDLLASVMMLDSDELADHLAADDVEESDDGEFVEPPRIPTVRLILKPRRRRLHKASSSHD